MKKQSAAEKLLELITELDDDILTEAIATDDEKKLRALVSKNKIFIFKPLFLRVAALILCVGLVLASVILQNVDKNTTTNITANNSFPSTETSSNSKVSSELKEDASSSEVLHNQNGSSSNISSEKPFDNSTSTDKYQSQQEQSSEESSSNNVYKDYFINSIDKMNFYMVKAAIENGGVLPVSKRKAKKSNLLSLSGSEICYKIDLDTVFWVTRGCYFTITLNEKNGFLAKKLGGIGLVEVVVIENSVDDMITFKRGERFYSCILNEKTYADIGLYSNEKLFFSTHKYIDGFNVVRNPDPVNFMFIAYYKNIKESSELTDFSCNFYRSSNSDNSNLLPDSVTLNKNSIKVVNIEQFVTVNDLEKIYKENLK